MSDELRSIDELTDAEIDERWWKFVKNARLVDKWRLFFDQRRYTKRERIKFYLTKTSG